MAPTLLQPRKPWIFFSLSPLPSSVYISFSTRGSGSNRSDPYQPCPAYLLNLSASNDGEPLILKEVLERQACQGSKSHEIQTKERKRQVYSHAVSPVGRSSMAVNQCSHHAEIEKTRDRLAEAQEEKGSYVPPPREWNRIESSNLKTTISCQAFFYLPLALPPCCPTLSIVFCFVLMIVSNLRTRAGFSAILPFPTRPSLLLFASSERIRVLMMPT